MMNIETLLFPKSNVKVFVRPLPRSDENYKFIKVLDDKKSILAKCLQNFSLDRQQPEFYWKYQVDKVFYNSNQKEVYDVVIGDCIKQALEGNCTVFIGYGQTNSGKSFTMNGLHHNYQQRGIGPRIISELLETKTKYEHEYNIELGVSYCEIRGNEFYDLLNPDSYSNKINVSKYGKFDNITLMIVSSEEQVLKILFEGEGRRQINKKSKFSNSHLCSSILTYYIVATSTNSSFPIQKLSKIQVVDLAGVDKAGNFTSFGKTAVDIGLANKDLTSLKTFLMLLHPSKYKDVDMQVIHRHSLLVHFLSDTVNGKSFLRFICHIKTNGQYHPITLSMLRITQTIKGIKPTKLNPNTRIQPEAQVSMLEKLLEKYKQEMIRIAIFNGEELENYMCKSRFEHLKRLTEDYLKHNTSQLNITSYGQIKPVLYIMRDKYDELNEECADIAKKEYERGLAEASQHEGSKARLTPPSPNPLKLRKKESKPSLAKTNTPRTAVEVPDSVVSIPESAGELNLAYGKGIGPGISAVPTKTGKPPTAMKQPSNETFTQITGLNREDIWSKFMATEIAISLTDKLSLAQRRKNILITEYNTAVKTLNKCHIELDQRKQTLRQAQMHRYLYKNQEYNPDGLILPTEEEKQCLSNMYEAKTLLRQQIDIVAVLQSDLKIANDEIMKLQTDIEYAFQSYAFEHYEILSPKLFETVEETSVSPRNAEDKIITSELMHEHYRRTSLTDIERAFKNQQKVMKKLAKSKQLNDFHKNRKWVSDYKH